MAKPTVAITFRLNVDIEDRFQAYVTDCRQRGETPTTRTAALSEALSRWLTDRGFPPKGSHGAGTER